MGIKIQKIENNKWGQRNSENKLIRDFAIWWMFKYREYFSQQIVGIRSSNHSQVSMPLSWEFPLEFNSNFRGWREGSMVNHSNLGHEFVFQYPLHSLPITLVPGALASVSVHTNVTNTFPHKWKIHLKKGEYLLIFCWKIKCLRWIYSELMIRNTG